jgi:hypothetical protein
MGGLRRGDAEASLGIWHSRLIVPRRLGLDPTRTGAVGEHADDDARLGVGAVLIATDRRWEAAPKGT